MTQSDIERKQLILIDYIQSLLNSNSTETWKVKAEYSTNDNDIRVVTIQEQAGNKVVFYCDCVPLFNYYLFVIYGLSIQENKNISLLIGNLIGNNIIVSSTYNDGTKTYDEKWQIMFKQFSNPQAVAYEDIRRVGYNMTFQCIVNKISSKEQ